MNVSSFKTFNAKILLFGEHLINLGSDALSIPYPQFHGKLQKTEDKDSRLLPFLNFLRSSQFSFLDELKLSTNNSLKFSSNIPEGYGSGSSGAIVASCYDHFRTDNIIDPKTLRERFSKMEAFYHGKSSGTDPLISYLDTAIKFNSDDSIDIIPELNTSFENYSLILVDSGRSREGKEYIKWFLSRLKGRKFVSILAETLVPATHNCIESYLTSSETDFRDSFAIISNIQSEHMGKLIPDNMKSLWASGQRSGDLYLKICGAGGGGFFIGLIQKDAQLPELAKFKTYSLS